MDRRRFVVTSASIGAVVAAVAAGCSGKLGGGGGALDSLLSGRVGESTQTITVQYATTTIQGKRFRGRTYDGAIPGPTIFTRPGSVLAVDIANRLPPNPPAKCPTGQMMIPDIRTEEESMMPPKRYRLTRKGTQIDCMNNPHDFNTTNLHTHGIQTTPHLFQPIGTSDPMSKLIAIEPGKHFRYKLPVPGDHPSGLHWYHPHHHGATDVQVSNGMAGLIVVRGPIDEVPEIAAARELFLIVQTLNVNKSKTPDLYDLEYVAYKSPKDGGYYVDSDFTMFTVATDSAAGRTNAQGVKWVVNDPDHETYTSYPPPTFDMQPGEVIRLRFLNGANANTLPLILPGMEVWQIGFDGVNLPKPTLKDMSGNVPGGLTPKNFIAAPVRMTVPGNRIEFLIKAPDKPGTYTLSSLKADELHGPAENIDLMQFIVSGEKKDMAIPTTLPATPREEPPIGPNAKQREFTLSFKGSADRVLTGFEFLVNDTLYDEMSVPTNVQLNGEEEWIIKNTTGSIHPFHIHVNSFQLVAINGVEKPGEIWDTFYVPPKSSTEAGVYGSITIRLRFKEFTGKSVHHCHFLSHEDTGMMQNFTIH